MKYALRVGQLLGVIFCSSLSGVAVASHSPGLGFLASLAAGVFGGFLLFEASNG